MLVRGNNDFRETNTVPFRLELKGLSATSVLEKKIVKLITTLFIQRRDCLGHNYSQIWAKVVLLHRAFILSSVLHEFEMDDYGREECGYDELGERRKKGNVTGAVHRDVFD